MKKIFKPLKFLSLIVLLLVSIIACDKDYNSIGSDLLGDNNFNTNNVKFPIVAYTKKLNPIQSNGLPSNLLGVYFDPIYDGITSASVVSQLVPDSYNPDFGTNPEIDSIVLTIPYYSTLIDTDDDGNNTYKLDSLFGDQPFKFSIYQNNYFLREYDPDAELEEAQNYFSNGNQTIDFNAHVGELLYLNESFEPSSDEIIFFEDDEETGEPVEVGRLTPSFRVELLNPNSFWEDLLFAHQDMPELSNQNNFKDFFRGLYFKAEAENNNGNMIMMNFSNANVIVYYSNESEDIDADREHFTYNFSFTGTKVNLIDNNFNSPINDGNETTGDEQLYLKGGEGSMAVINLFEGVLTDENGIEHNSYDYFENNFKDVNGDPKRLINEANIEFYVNQSLVTGDEPERILLYDLKSNTPIIDYFFDNTTNNNDPISSKINYSTPLEIDEDERGVKYKIRVTEHINNILLKDSTNLKLGLVVSTNINSIQQAEILDSDEEDLNMIPTGAFLSPKGTILHGSHPNVAEENRAQLKIYYTEPNN